ncbi:MAG: molybdopterin molybdenumtransferase MoeA, partial [Caldimonas sp.]
MSANPNAGFRPNLLSLDEAVERLLARVAVPSPDSAQTVSTFDALRRVLARDVRSRIDVPPADNSAMDGYAVRVADVPAAGTVLRVSQRIAAGSVGAPLEPGTAARIFTGAQIPSGADAVV